MSPSRLVTECLAQRIKREGLVDDRLHVIGIQGADHLDLLLAVADLQPLKPYGL